MEIKVGQIWKHKSDTYFTQPAKVIHVDSTDVIILDLTLNKTYTFSKHLLKEQGVLASEYLAKIAFDKELEELLNA